MISGSLEPSSRPPWPSLAYDTLPFFHWRGQALIVVVGAHHPVFISTMREDKSVQHWL
jgi:hypothetical protein